MSDKLKTKNKIIFIIGLILVICGIGFFAYYMRVLPAFEEQTYELGSVDISKNVEDYLVARNSVLQKASLDFSNVNENEVGDYTIFCNTNRKEYSYTIHIVDTTQPVIKFNDRNIIFGTYNEYRLDDIASAVDLSDIDKFEILSCINNDNNTKANVENNAFTLEEVGDYTLNIIAEDKYGNTTNLEQIINVKEAPHFVMLYDRKYGKATYCDILDFVFAEDKDGNDISDKVTVLDDGGYNPKKEGSYDVTYSVKDKDNIERKQTITITIQGTRDNDYGCEKEEFIKTLVDRDYFAYEPLENNDDMDKLVDLTSPASFSVKTQGNTLASGSCFLYEVTADALYFITNKHCSVLFTELEIVLVDYRGFLTYINSQNVETFKSDNRDIMCFKIPYQCFDMDEMPAYKKVSIDLTKFDELEINQKMLVNAQEHGISLMDRTDRIQSVTLRSPGESQIYSLTLDYPYLTANEAVIKDGESGSPLFNYDGYLIGVSASTAILREHQNVDMFIRLPDVVEFMDTVEMK